MEQDSSKMNDHDLLITVHEQIKNVRSDIKELKDGTGAKLADHEARIRKNVPNNLKWIFCGVTS